MIDSVKALIISVVYLIIPGIISAVFGALLGQENIITLAVSFVICQLFALLIITLIRFAKEIFGDTFQNGAIFAKIGKIGWLIMVLLTPFLVIGFARYYTNVCESA